MNALLIAILNRRWRPTALVAALTVGMAFVGGVAPICSAADVFESQSLADHVFLYSPVDAGKHGIERNNSLVIEQSTGLVIVGAQPTPQAAKELIAAVKERTDAPIKFLVLTSPTAASVGGASAFPSSTTRIATELFHAKLEEPTFNYGAETRTLSGQAENWVGPPRPTRDMVLEGPMQLSDSNVTVRVRPANGGYSTGGVVAEINGTSIIYAGAFIAPAFEAPWADEPRMDLWMREINRLITSQATHYIPREGEVVSHDDLLLQRDGLAWVRGQIESAFIKKMKVPEIIPFIVNDDRFTDYYDMNRTPERIKVWLDESLKQIIHQRNKRGLEVRYE